MATKPLLLLDQGVELWRRSLRRDLWLYYGSSLPFAVALLWFGQQADAASMPRVWGPALVLALAYAGRSLGTGTYSRCMLGVCGGTAPPSSAATRLREVWIQALLMLLWWLALPCLLGVGLIYMAGQYVPLLPERKLGAAWRLSLRWWPQQWVLLGLALLLGGIALANLAMTALLSPLLLHSLFGLGGPLSFSGASLFLMQSGLFWVGLLLAVYLILDPVMKCTAVVSWQQLRARRDGTELEAALAGVRQEVSAPTPWTALAGLAPAPAALERAIQAELRQPAYAWHSSQNSPINLWLQHAMGRVFAPLGGMAHGLALGWQQLWEWLRRIFAGMPVLGAHGASNSRWQRWEWLLAGVCLLLAGGWAAHILRRRRWEQSPAAAAVVLEPLPVDVAGASAAAQGESEWFAAAARLGQAGELRLALRAAFLAGLAGLAGRKLVSIRRDRTNREYLDEYARRARLAGAEAQGNHERVRASMRTFDEVWYGGREVSAERLEQFVALQREMLSHV